MRRARAWGKEFMAIMRNVYSCDDTLTELIISDNDQYCGECERHTKPKVDIERVLRCDHCESRFAWLVDLRGSSDLGMILMQHYCHQLEQVPALAKHHHIALRRSHLRHTVKAR